MCEPIPYLCDLSVRMVVKLCTLGFLLIFQINLPLKKKKKKKSLCLRGGLGFLNYCADNCICVVNKQFVSNSVDVDL